MTIIRYDPLCDLQNWLRISKKYPDSFQFTKQYPFNRTLLLQEDTLPRIVQTIAPNVLGRFRNQAVILEKVWMRHEGQIEKIITAHLRVPQAIPVTYHVNLTTAYLMPYDVRSQWFMVPTHKSIEEQIRVMIHEVFHLLSLKENPTMKRKELEKEVETFFANDQGINEILKKIQKESFTA